MPAIHVPIYQQQLDYTCGPAALASCLEYWGVWKGDESQLYSLLGTTSDGTSGADLIRVAQSYGLWAEERSQLTIHSLLKMLEDGYTAILSIQAGLAESWEDGHYVVLVNLINGQLEYMDPRSPCYLRMFTEEFEERWHDWNDLGDQQEYHSAIIIWKR